MIIQLVAIVKSFVCCDKILLYNNFSRNIMFDIEFVVRSESLVLSVEKIDPVTYVGFGFVVSKLFSLFDNFAPYGSFLSTQIRTYVVLCSLWYFLFYLRTKDFFIRTCTSVCPFFLFFILALCKQSFLLYEEFLVSNST